MSRGYKSPSAPVATARARVGAYSTSVRAGYRSPDDPTVIGAKRDLIAANLEDHVEKVLAGWPKLTDAQLDRIAGMLRAGGAE
jgi:hypothetical protein